jgi:hypothetical protein
VAADCIRHAQHGFSDAVAFEHQEEGPRIARITRMNLDASSNPRNQRFSTFLPCGCEHAGGLGTRGFVASDRLGTCGSGARREHPILRGLSGGMPCLVAGSPLGTLHSLSAGAEQARRPFSNTAGTAMLRFLSPSRFVSFAFRWHPTGWKPAVQDWLEAYPPPRLRPDTSRSRLFIFYF